MLNNIYKLLIIKVLVKHFIKLKCHVLDIKLKDLNINILSSKFLSSTLLNDYRFNLLDYDEECLFKYHDKKVKVTDPTLLPVEIFDL